MSLTSYRAAPPRVERCFGCFVAGDGLGVYPAFLIVRGISWRGCGMDWKTWRRPTLPCLKTQYHGRWGFSRPSSGRDRVRAPRQSHQVVRSIHQSSVCSRRLSDGRMVRFWCVCVCFLMTGAWKLATVSLAMISRQFSGDDFHAWCLRSEPIGRSEPVSFMGCPTSTPGLST